MRDYPATGPNARFITTSGARSCAQAECSSDALEALDDLCRIVAASLFVRSPRRPLPEDAKDMVQEFIAHLLRRKDLASVSPEKGRFRSFLLTALKHFLCSRGRSRLALKRGGGMDFISLDLEQAEALCQPELRVELAPDKAFDRCWASTVMAQALERLRREHRTPGQAKLFLALQPALAEGSRVDKQADLALQLGVTPGALAVATTRLRQRYRALILEEVGRTVAKPGDLAEELMALRSAWS
ncbi:MAG: ECF-type sigma factor [Verrucomicrobiota bacterium]